MKTMKITAVIPAYNEEKTIGIVIRELKLTGIKDIVVVNDASTDKTAKIAANNGARVYTNDHNEGHAKSLIRGLWIAKSKHILYLDADNQIRPSPLITYDFIDLVSGYRVHRHDRLFRKVISLILRYVIYLRHGFMIRDANCPYKLMTRTMVRSLLVRLPCPCRVPSIDLEILARQYGYIAVQIPVKHYPYIEKRRGTLQSLNLKSIRFFFDAFKEVWNL